MTEELEPRLEEARQGKSHVFFVDAAHFVMRPFLGFLWCFVRQFIQAPSGRKRFNVLGALHATTLQVVTFTNDSYINSFSVAKLMCKIAVEFAGLPITLIMDNARYQRCRFVMDLATALSIELLFLPSYSPNLNLNGCESSSRKSVCIPSIMKRSPISSRLLRIVSLKPPEATSESLPVY